MAYQVDPDSGDIVIGGFDQGIGASPYSGLTDMRNINNESVPGEAVVNFATATQIATSTVSSGTMAVDINGILNFNPASTGFLENGQAIFVTSSTVSNITGATAVTYYIRGSSKQSAALEWLSLGIVYGGSDQFALGTTGTLTFSTFNPAKPKYFQKSAGQNWMLDASGQVWSDLHPTTGGTSIPSTSSWTYVGNQGSSGNSGDPTANGNGFVYWRTANSSAMGNFDGYLFVFRDGQIDYAKVDTQAGNVTTPSWVYGWKPSAGSTGQTNYLLGSAVSACPHDSIVGFDGRIYFTDYYNVSKISQTDIVTPITFDPAITATYTYTTYDLLPINDVATCLAPLGTTMLIGGILNNAYNWDTTSNLVTNAIPLAEGYVSKMVTVNMNTYLFVGNRGRIYITNGSQAQEFVKVPDHLSGTISPYFSWGGASFQKNNLLFGVLATDNSGAILTSYGGVWAVSLNTKAIRLVNELSYGTFAGYASAIMPILPNPDFPAAPINPAGFGFYAGWYNGSTYGIDKSSSVPYAAGQAYVISDAIPVGTSIQPTTSQQIEWKTSVPMTSNESIQLLVGSTLGGTFTSAGTTSGDGSLISDIYPMPVEKQQWCFVKAVLTSTATTPTYCRLAQMRIIGGTIKSGVANAPYGLR